ncbi:uncharacterized protein LOC122500944 [Leptopilina heterotoma]|uniref:uncharacterized protein LOC122500944 n=1 Tax=Leptopilina heterotoma TaxID=63436 RepID=UPI001CA8A2E8|nr:uncharacterized protein LOC122500944 [Leptopilina heterotoma]
MSVDILEPLPLEKWKLLAKTLKNNWPANIQCYYYLRTAEKWKLKEPNIPITVYCPHGDYNSGIFIAISSITIYLVFPFAHEGFEDFLYKTVTETKFIKWDKRIFFPAMQSRLIQTVNSIIEFLKVEKKIKMEWCLELDCYFKSKEECSITEVRLPEDCYLRELDHSHVPLIHALWPHRSREDPELTTRQVSAMINFNGGLGLFSRETGQLLSWAVQSEIGAISLVQTIDRCQRRGYAKIVTNAFAKLLASKNIDSFVFIGKENSISKLMFSSSSWKYYDEIHWIELHSA